MNLINIRNCFLILIMARRMILAALTVRDCNFLHYRPLRIKNSDYGKRFFHFFFVFVVLISVLRNRAFNLFL